MKNISMKSCLVLITILIFITACDKDLIMFNSSMNLVGFSAPSLVMREDGNGDTATIYLGAEAGSAGTTVTLVVDTAGLGEAAAIEGTDFTISSKSIPVSVGESEVTIIPINNDIFTGDKKFYLVISGNSMNYKVSAQKRLLVTISDDEHPLKAWIGTYTVSATSYGNPGSWDESWSVTTSPVEGNINQLSILGLGNGSTQPVIATLDMTALTITINSAQALGAAYGVDNGPVKLYYGTTDIIDMVIAQEYLTTEIIAAASSIPITGTLEENGTIHLDKMAMILSDYDWCWDVFNTRWDKQK
jgi:hypothetical protein